MATEEERTACVIGDEVECRILERISQACASPVPDLASAQGWADVYLTFQRAWYTDPSTREEE